MPLFCLALPASGSLCVAEAAKVAVHQLNIEHTRSPVSPIVTLSLGVAIIDPSLNLSADSLITAADLALYEAKNLGRDRVVLKTFNLMAAQN